MILDGTAMRVDHLFLNSEFISWSDSQHTTHEITNVYATDKTEYHSFAPIYLSKIPNEEKIFKPISDHYISIPLIPLDLNNPVGMVDRIKKLNLFS